MNAAQPVLTPAELAKRIFRAGDERTRTAVVSSPIGKVQAGVVTLDGVIYAFTAHAVRIFGAEVIQWL